MSFVSLNVHGLGKVSRAQALSNLVYTINPAIVMLQETMCDDSFAISKICKILPNWEVVAVSSCGLLGGLAIVVFQEVLLLHGIRLCSCLKLTPLLGVSS